MCTGTTVERKPVCSGAFACEATTAHSESASAAHEMNEAALLQSSLLSTIAFRRCRAGGKTVILLLFTTATVCECICALCTHFKRQQPNCVSKDSAFRQEEAIEEELGGKTAFNPLDSEQQCIPAYNFYRHRTEPRRDVARQSGISVCQTCGPRHRTRHEVRNWYAASTRGSCKRLYQY